MILPDSFKNSNNTNDEKNYEYKFKRNGTIVQKPTDLGHSFATIKQNRALKGLKGVDDYSGFTTKGKRNSLIYQFDSPNDISDFKFANDNNNDYDNNKEERAKKRAAKGKRRRGTAFTINNDKVADELYRAVAGNSNVEYMKVKYEPTNKASHNYIETDKNTKNVFIGLKTGDNATSMTHSHPFTIDTQNNTYNSKYPSELDTNGYKLVNKAVKGIKEKMPNHYLYHPVSPDINKMPHTIEYNQNGAIEYKHGKPVNINNAALEANEALYRKTYFK